MPVGRKASTPSAVDVDALIEKGGSHAAGASDDGGGESDVQKITVRLPRGLVRRIDAALENRPIRISRNQWLAEAAYEMLKGEK